MDRRFSLGLVVLLLIGGALYLALHPEQQSASAPQPTANTIAPTTDPVPATAGHRGLYILAVEWLPAFCAAKSSLPECRGTPAPRFALHGLWPDDEYCGVSAATKAIDLTNHWNDLPAVDLSGATRAALDAAMPGTRSHLERHEWVTHGTCAGVTADRYFARAAEFASAIDRSPLHELFTQASGSRLTRARIAAYFDRAFGNGAGDRIRLSCSEDSRRPVIVELTIAVYGDPFGPSSLADLMATAHPRNGGCAGGYVP